MKVLAADIGGTNARFALVEVGPGRMRVLHERRLASRDFPGAVPMIRDFLAQVRATPSRACLGIACPIVNGRCRPTNLSWSVDVATLGDEIGVPHTTVINDLHAIGYGLAHLKPEDLVTLQDGEPDPAGVVALIAAGTGLGQAFLTRAEGEEHVHDSEGGHASFAARTEEEWELRGALARRFGHVCAEHVVSGPGLVRIYRHLAGGAAAPAVEEEMESEDPAAVVSRHALDRTDPHCVRALDLFAYAYGAVAGDLALTVMATGGVFVAGGIAPRILPKLREGGFVTAFRDKGVMAEVTARIPVRVVMDPDVGLLGAAAVAARS